MLFLLQILHLLLTLYCSVVFLRFAAQWHGADFRNPISQALVQITNPPLLPLRRIVPGWKGKDIAAIVLLGLIVLIEVLLMSFVFGSSNNIISLFLTVIYRMLSIAVNSYFYALIISAIVSWVNPNPYNPVQLFFGPITAPVLRPLQKRIKPLAGSIDITPLIALLVIYIIKYGLSEVFIQIQSRLLPLTSGDRSLIMFMLQ